MRFTRHLHLRSGVLVAVALALGSAAGAGTFKLHDAGSVLRFETRTGGGGVTELTDTPPLVAGGLPFVYFVDFAWTAPATHLVVRNPNFGEARVRVTHALAVPSLGGSGGISVTTGSYVVASGGVLHAAQNRRPSPRGQFGLNYALIASDRPLLVSARAFGGKRAHELVPRELACPGAGDILDPEAPDAFFCDLARR